MLIVWSLNWKTCHYKRKKKTKTKNEKAYLQHTHATNFNTKKCVNRDKRQEYKLQINPFFFKNKEKNNCRKICEKKLSLRGTPSSIPFAGWWYMYSKVFK